MNESTIMIHAARRGRGVSVAAVSGLALCVALLVSPGGPAGAVPPGGTITEADLLPVALGASTEGVRELIARKRFAEAAKAISQRSAEAQLVRGWLLMQANRAVDALGTLENKAMTVPGLGTWARVLRGRALLDLKRPEDALAAVDGVGGDDEVGRQARRVLARASREAERHEDARRIYQEMIGSGQHSEIPVGLLGLARLEHELGQHAEAVGLLRRLDLEYPAHWTASAGRKLAAGLTASDPKLAAAWTSRTAEETIARAEKLLDKHRNQDTEETLAPLDAGSLDAALLCRRQYALGRAYRKLRKWEAARPLLEAAVTACEEAASELAPWARYVAAAAAERLGFEDEAAAHYRAQMDRNPSHRLADDAGYLLVRHLIEDKKDLAAARAEVERLVVRFPAGDMVPDAIFFVAQTALLERKYDVARAVLALDARLAPRDFRDRDAGRVEYWLARIDHLQKRRSLAISGYRQVIATYPLGWYALLAYGRYRELDLAAARKFAQEALTRESPGPSLPGGDAPGWRFAVPAALNPEAWSRAVALARLGLGAEAWQALRDAGAGSQPDTLWLSAWLLDRAGAWHLSHDILRRKLPEFRRLPPSGDSRKHWLLAFPLPFRALITRAARDAGIDPFLAWAIMREESGFNAGAESFANAIGLMQLILPTAKGMTKKGEPAVTRATLTDPDVNVRLGTRYLARVKEQSGAAWALVPAGYNAGGGALKRWLAARSDLPLDLFVETIPFEEARGYVKRVTATWATYRWLYADTLTAEELGQKVKKGKPKKPAKPADPLLVIGPGLK